MSDFDPIRLAKPLELASHPATHDGEALNSLRAARALLIRAGRGLGDLAWAAAPKPDEVAQLREALARAQANEAAQRAEISRLRRLADRAEVLRTELAFLKGTKDAAADAQDPSPDRLRRPSAKARVTGEVVSVFDLLSEWRSVPDLVEKLGTGIAAAGVKRIVRLLDDKGLLRSVESWPTRYRLRFEGELDGEAKAFRSRIEDVRSGQ